MKYRVSTVLVLSALLFWYSAEAQVAAGSFLSGGSEKGPSTNYFFARPSDLTIIVNVIGFIQRPGRYEIASTIDLVNLIALAGGATAEGSLEKITIVRMSKEGEKVQRKEIQVDLENITAVNAQDLILAPGDLVKIDRKSWTVYKDILVVAASIATIVTTFILVDYYRR